MRGSSVAMRGALVAAILLVVSSVGSAARTTPRGLLSATSGHAEDAGLGSDDMFDLFSKHANKFPFEPSMEGGAAGESGTCSFPKFESHEPPNMVQSCSQNAAMGIQEFGGYTRESGDSPAAIEVGKYAILKLNCARKHAETPCAPLVSAKVLEAYEHVTATQFWYVNISIGHDRLVKATVAVDEVLIAEDIDCPELAMNEFSPFNLIKLQEFADPNSDAPPIQVTDVCKFERESTAVTPPKTHATPSSGGGAFDFDDFDIKDFKFPDHAATTAALGEDPLGIRQLRVEGQPWSPPELTQGERDAHIMSALGGDDRALTGAVPAYTCDPPKKAPADFVPPKNFDLRDEYSYCKADHPGNQGQCGSCWAFGYSYMYSYRMCVQTKGRWNDVISQQQFVACEWGGSCNGGLDDRAAKGQAKGWDTVEACPERSEFAYTKDPGSEKCMSRDKAEIDNGQVRAYAPKMSTLVISNFKNGRGTQVDCKGQRTSITKEEHIKWAMHEIMNYGPVTVVNYASGMERGTPATGIHCKGGEGSQANHMLIVVGWGETDAGEKYWLIQNSWGDTWKDNGRIKIDRGNNGCRIEERFGKVDADFDIMFDPASLTTPDCSNDGVIDWDTKTCVCKPPWKGPGVAGDEGHPGCEICGIKACANDGIFDADACTCTCKDGYGGPKCETSISANVASGKLAATLRLGEFATVNSDVAVAVRVGKSGEWKPVSDRGELCGKIVDGDPTPCPEVDKSRALKVNIDLAKKGITQVGEEIFVKFVQNLGLNEFGNPRGYEMDRYGKGLIASAGPYQGDSCSDVVVTVSVPEGQYGKLSWTVGQGDGVSERVDVTLEGKAVVEEMSACLANEADHKLKVTGHINPGSAFGRFSAKVKQSDYDNAEIMSTGSVFAFPADLLFETPSADPSGDKKRRLDGAAPFRVWPAKPSGSKCALVKVSVTASAFGNGAAASMMEYDLLPAAKGEADTRLYASPGSFAFGTTRHDLACVAPGKYAFVAGVSGHAFGAGGWGHGSEWSVSTLDGTELAGVPVEDSADWFSSGEMKFSEVFDVPDTAASAALGRSSRRRALLAARNGGAENVLQTGSSLGADAARGVDPLTAGLAALAVVAAVVAGVAAHNPAASSSALLQKRRGEPAGYGATPNQAAPADAAAPARNASVFGARGVAALVGAVAFAAVVTARGVSHDDAVLQSPVSLTDAAKMSLPSAPLATPKGKGDYFDDYGEKNMSLSVSSAADYGEAEDGSTQPGGSINVHFDDYDHDDDHDLAEGDYAAVDEEMKALLARLSSGAGCGKGVSPCSVLHSPDCRSPRTYLYSPGVVAELHPNGKVLHPLNSVTSDTNTHQIMERVTCPAGVAEDEVCITKHRAAIEDVSADQCREACDKTELCVAFTHHVATDDTAKVGGFGHTCTLLAGVSGDGAVSRASAGSNADDVAGEPRSRLRGHTTYFLQPDAVDLSQMDDFKHLNSKCDKPAAGSNAAEQAPKDCVVVDEDYESAVAAMGARFSFSTSTTSIPKSPFDVESQDMASEPHSGDDEKTEGYTFDWPPDWDNWPPKRNKPPPPPPMSPPPAPVPGSYAVLAWASILNDGAPVTIDTITVKKPVVGAKIVAGTPLRYVVCEEIADASFKSTSKCGGVVADAVWLIKLPEKEDKTFEACGVTVTVASKPADVYVPLPKDFTLADGSQPATPKKHWGYIERADMAFDPAAPPPPKPKEYSPPPPLPPPQPMQPAYPGNPPPLPSPPPAPHTPPSPPPPDPYDALVKRKLKRLESYSATAKLAEQSDEELPDKIKRRLKKLEAFAEMYELSGEKLPVPVPKFIQPKKANTRGQKSCADLEWPIGNPTRYPFVCGVSSVAGKFACNDAATFDDAVETCRAAGGWLCRNNEVTAADSGSECQADDAMVWTHRPCGEGKYQQRPANGGEGVCVSSAKENLAAVRCCSNRE